MTVNMRSNSAITMLLAVCLLFPLLPLASADERSREAIEALEAYAVYKMGMYGFCNSLIL